MLDLKIINGKLIDTEKEQLLPLQFGIKDGKIACIGEDLPDAVRVIPGGGDVPPISRQIRAGRSGMRFLCRDPQDHEHAGGAPAADICADHKTRAGRNGRFVHFVLFFVVIYKIFLYY